MKLVVDLDSRMEVDLEPTMCMRDDGFILCYAAAAGHRRLTIDGGSCSLLLVPRRRRRRWVIMSFTFKRVIGFHSEA